ncbi:MAG: urea carboxylase-associated family protein [Candidatus Eremiobacteraeota bacterium]|nr:urea carboxylase-associated family protein [Candidatus Eremiobacteraeota bacterium]
MPQLKPVNRLEPQTGTAFVLRKGQSLRIIDPQGQQVADLAAFCARAPGEWLSSGRTIDYNQTIYVTSGAILYSNRSNPMFRIGEDRVRRHDFLLTPCSEEMFKLLGRCDGPHPSCLGNLASALQPFGIASDQIPTTFNVFMNVEVSSSGVLRVGTPQSRAGDFVDLEALCELIVGLTACSSEYTNNGACKPIDFSVLS